MRLIFLLFVILLTQYCLAKNNKNKEYFHLAQLWVENLERKIEAEDKKCKIELSEVKDRLDSQRLDYGGKLLQTDQKIDFEYKYNNKNMTRSGGMARQAGSEAVS